MTGRDRWMKGSDHPRTGGDRSVGSAPGWSVPCEAGAATLQEMMIQKMIRIKHPRHGHQKSGRSCNRVQSPETDRSQACPKCVLKFSEETECTTRTGRRL